MLAKMVVNWGDKKMDKILQDKSKLAYVKAIGVGVVEGFVDAAIIFGSYDLIKTYGEAIVKAVKK